MVINGFRIQGITNLEEVECELSKVERKLSKMRTQAYHKLLGKEIAFMSDCITLGILTKPQDGTILDCAIHELDKKINNAQILGMKTEYNLQVFIHLLIYENDTYIRVDSWNDEFLKAFRSLEDYSLSEEECQDSKNKKNIIWQQLHKLYENKGTFSKNLTTDIKIDPDKIKYPSKNERCETIARQTVTNGYLNQLSGGNQIPPYLLMPYMDEALELVMSPLGQMECKKKKLHLQNLLLDLTEDNGFITGKNEKGEQLDCNQSNENNCRNMEE